MADVRALSEAVELLRTESPDYRLMEGLCYKAMRWAQATSPHAELEARVDMLEAATELAALRS